MAITQEDVQAWLTDAEKSAAFLSKVEEVRKRRIQLSQPPGSTTTPHGVATSAARAQARPAQQRNLELGELGDMVMSLSALQQDRANEEMGLKVMAILGADMRSGRGCGSTDSDNSFATSSSSVCSSAPGSFTVTSTEAREQGAIAGRRRPPGFNSAGSSSEPPPPAAFFQKRRTSHPVLEAASRSAGGQVRSGLCICQ